MLAWGRLQPGSELLRMPAWLLGSMQQKSGFAMGQPASRRMTSSRLMSSSWRSLISGPNEVGDLWKIRNNAALVRWAYATHVSVEDGVAVLVWTFNPAEHYIEIIAPMPDD
jgi:hypothetical protein